MSYKTKHRDKNMFLKSEYQQAIFVKKITLIITEEELINPS